MSDRNVTESPQRQGPNEQIAYKFDWTAEGTPSAAGTVAIVDQNAPTVDLSATLLSGSASLSGNTVTTPLVKSLTAGVTYLLRSTVSISGNTLSAVL